MKKDAATTPFDDRVRQMDSDDLPDSEVTAAAITYERLLTARAIAISVLKAPSTSDTLAVFGELCAEASRASRSG